jgi:hemolysin III
MSEQISQSMHSENKKKKQKKKSDSKSAALMRNTFHLSFGEEVGNAVSHGVMMFLLLFADPLVCLYAYLQQGWLRFAGTMIYMLCMIIMFGGSCLYHIMPYDTEWKYVFRKLDHISILLAIAGTYTPICLCLVQGWLGWIVLALEWLLALAGILLKSISSKAFPKLSMTLYMCMGWLALPFDTGRRHLLYDRRLFLRIQKALHAFCLASVDHRCSAVPYGCHCFLSLKSNRGHKKKKIKF